MDHIVFSNYSCYYYCFSVASLSPAILPYFMDNIFIALLTLGLQIIFRTSGGSEAVQIHPSPS